MAPLAWRRQVILERRLLMARPLMLRCGVQVEPVASAQGIDKRYDENEAAGENHGQAQYPAASRWLGPSRESRLGRGGLLPGAGQAAAQGRGEKAGKLHRRGYCSAHGISFASNFTGCCGQTEVRGIAMIRTNVDSDYL
jgi:hypothetical protein